MMTRAKPDRSASWPATMRRGLCVLVSLSLMGCGDKDAKTGNGVKELNASAGTTTTSPLVRAMQTLRERGIDTRGGVRNVEGDLRFSYETSNATKYDDELLVVWATTFGALGRLAKRKVTIVNTVGGKPVAEVSASSHDIRGMLDGAISTRQFMQRLTITSVERHEEEAAAPESTPMAERVDEAGGETGGETGGEAAATELNKPNEPTEPESRRARAAPKPAARPSKQRRARRPVRRPSKRARRSRPPSRPRVIRPGR
ncbi:MAG: hypothetical protein KC502_09925 [Myxococcales bacterium]|nr:hypothetical protein [Myxococcales bacterium]